MPNQKICHVNSFLFAMFFCCFTSLAYAQEMLVMKLPTNLQNGLVQKTDKTSYKSTIYMTREGGQNTHKETLEVDVYKPGLKLEPTQLLTEKAKAFVGECPSSVVYPLHRYSEQNYPMAMIAYICLKAKDGKHGEIVMEKAMQTKGGIYFLSYKHDAPVLDNDNTARLSDTFLKPILQRYRAFLDSTYVCDKSSQDPTACMPGRKIVVKHLGKENLKLGLQ